MSRKHEYMMLQANEVLLCSGRRWGCHAAFPLNGARFAAREYAQRMKCCYFLADGSRFATHFLPTVHVFGGRAKLQGVELHFGDLSSEMSPKMRTVAQKYQAA